MLFLGTGINVDLNQVFHFKDNISTQPSNDTANKHNISLPRQSPSSSSLSLHKPTPATSPNTIHLNVKVLKVLLNFCVKAKTMLESPVVPTTDTQITPGDESLSSSLFFLQRDRRKAIMNQRSASNRSGSTTSGSSSAHVSDKKQSQAQSQAPSPLSPSSSPSTHNSSQHHSTDLSPSTSPTPHEHYGLSEYRPRTHTRPFQLIGGTPSAISSTSLFSLLPDVLLTKILSAAIDPLTTTSVAEGMPQQHTQLDHNSPTATLLSYRDCSALLGKDEAQMLSMLRRMIKNYCIYCQSAQKEKNISEDLDKPSLLHNSFHSLTTTTAQTTPSSSSSSSTSSSSSSSVSVTTPSPPHPNSHFTTTPSSFSATSTSAEITNTSSSSSSSSSTSSSFSSSNHTLISTDSPHPSPPQPSYLSPLCFGDNGVIVLHTLSSVCARWKTIAPSAAYLCPPHPMPLAVRLLLLLARASLSVMDCWRSERKAERQKKKEEMERKKQLKAHSHNTSNMPSMMFSSSFLSSSFSTSNQRNDEAPHILRSSFTVLPTVLLQRCLLLQLFCSFSANLLSHCLEQLDKASPVKHPPQALICASQPKPSMNSSMVIPSSSALASSPASSETSSSSSSSFNRTSDTFAIASSPSSTPPPPSEQTATQPNLLIPSVNVPSPIRKLNGYPPATLSQQSPHHSTEEVPPLPLSSGTSTIVQVIRAPNREANTSPSSPLSFFSQPDSPLSDCSPTLMSPFTSPTINSKRYSLSSKKASSVNPFSVASNVAPLGETVSLPSKYSAPLQPSNNTALNTSSMDLSSPSSSSYSSSSPPSSRNSFARGTSRPHSLAGVVPPLRLHSSTRPLSTHTNPFVGAASLADQAEYPLTSSHSRPASKRLSLSTPRSSVSVSSQMNNSSSNYATTPASEEAAATFSTQLFDATSTRPVVVTFGETVNGENENSIAESARFDRNTNEDEDTRFRSSISKIGESNTPNETPRYGSLPSSRQRLPPPFLPQKNTTSTNQNKEQVSKRPTKAVQTPSVFEGIGSTMRSGSVSSTNHATPSIETSLQPKTYNTSSSSNASNEIQRLGKKGTRELPKKSNAAHLEVEQSSTDSSGSSIESFTLKCSTDRRPNTNYRMPFSTSPITTFPTLQSVRNASSNSAALSSASASPATSTTPVTLLFPSSGGDAWAEDDTTASSKQASSDISNASSSSSSIPSSSARHSQRGRIQRIQSSRYASSNEIETDADATSMTTTTMPYQSPDSVNSNLPSETSRSTYSRMSMNSSMSLHRHRSSSLTSRTTSTNASAAPSSRLSDWHRAAVEPMTSSQPLLSSPRAPLASSRLIHSSSFDLGSSRLLSRPSTAASSALQSEATPPSNAVAANQMNYSFQIGHAGNGDMDTCTTSSSSSSSSSSSGSSIFSSSFPSITQRGKYSTRDMDAPSKGSSSRREEMERDSSSVLSPSHIFKLSRQTSRASSVWSERDSINDVDDEWLEAEQKTLMAEEEKKEEKMRLKMLVEGAPKRSEEEEMEVESESSDSSDDLSEESEDFVKSSSRFEHSSVDILSRDQFSSMHLSPSASREALNAEDPALFLRIAFPYVSSSLSSLKAEAQKMIIEMISVYQKWKRRQHNHF